MALSVGRLCGILKVISGFGRMAARRIPRDLSRRDAERSIGLGGSVVQSLEKKVGNLPKGEEIGQDAGIRKPNPQWEHEDQMLLS